MISRNIETIHVFFQWEISIEGNKDFKYVERVLGRLIISSFITKVLALGSYDARDRRTNPSSSRSYTPLTSLFLVSG